MLLECEKPRYTQILLQKLKKASYNMTKEAITQLILEAESNFDEECSKWWNSLRIPIAQWTLNTKGVTLTFWVVAICGNEVLYFNHYESGFNWGAYESYGEIKDMWCNQDELSHALYTKYFITFGKYFDE